MQQRLHLAYGGLLPCLASHPSARALAQLQLKLDVTSKKAQQLMSRRQAKHAFIACRLGAARTGQNKQQSRQRLLRRLALPGSLPQMRACQLAGEGGLA
jgi:hypothetical protein